MTNVSRSDSDLNGFSPCDRLPLLFSLPSLLARSIGFITGADSDAQTFSPYQCRATSELEDGSRRLLSMAVALRLGVPVNQKGSRATVSNSLKVPTAAMKY